MLKLTGTVPFIFLLLSQEALMVETLLRALLMGTLASVMRVVPVFGGNLRGGGREKKLCSSLWGSAQG